MINPIGNMNLIDKRILRLIDLLIFEKEIAYVKEFCQAIGIIDTTIPKIKKGTSHFTVQNIQMICKIYNVNANWIFGLEKKVFNTPNSIEIKEI
jgi:hypothetical protein